jgi:glucose-6-phosphate 1-dehydrogenase
MKTKLLIFGISGDLSRRKLLPALHSIIRNEQFSNLDIMGVSRHEVDLDGLLKDLPELHDRTSVFSMDVAVLADYERLREHIALREDEQLLVYLSVPPAATRQIVSLLGEAKLNTKNTKLLLEKPFGVDLASARAMKEHVDSYFEDGQVYRIDHYLAKEMAQNIAAFRAGNALFSHVWNNGVIADIEIVASEKIGIEGRGQFYEQTGALRDVLQGHLMQLLALVLMEIPGELNWNDIPKKRLEALRLLHAADPALAIRAQYEGYEEEAKNPGSLTETFVSVELSSNDLRWKNVPIRLITGKALDDKVTEIRVNFRKAHDTQANRLVLRIQPNEGVEIELATKKPGYEREFEPRRLSFSYPIDTILPDAYEQVIVDAIRSHKSLFTSSEEVLESWRILQPILDTWEMQNAPLMSYSKHTSVAAILDQSQG